MTSILVDRGQVAHHELRAIGWKEDIAGPRPGTVWMNSPARFRVELTYVADSVSTLEVTATPEVGTRFEWSGHNTRKLKWFQNEIGLNGDNSEEACQRYLQTLVELGEMSIPRPAAIMLDIFDDDECERIFHDRHMSSETAVNAQE